MNTASDPICSSAGCTQFRHKGTPLGYDINYGVPNFGADTDMTDTKVSLSLAEQQLDHKWTFNTAESKKKWHNPAKDVMYNFKPKYDGEIDSSLKNLVDSQEKLNHIWNIADLQINSDIKQKSDPICSSAGCETYIGTFAKKPKYPMDYFVPNLGADR